MRKRLREKARTKERRRRRPAQHDAKRGRDRVDQDCQRRGKDKGCEQDRKEEVVEKGVEFACTVGRVAASALAVAAGEEPARPERPQQR